MITADDVTAIVVTKGDVHLDQIRADLAGYGETIVWDNSAAAEDLRVYGRYAAIEQATRPVIYFQDDDIRFTQHDRLLASYQPGVIVTNMDAAWINRGNYHDTCCVGAGSIVDRDLPAKAFAPYLARYDRDQLFLTCCDLILGVLAPHEKVDLGYTVLPQAHRGDRLCKQRTELEARKVALERARGIRDGVEEAA